MKKFLIALSILSILTIPSLSFAQAQIKSTNGGLVPCGTTSIPTFYDVDGSTKGGEILNPCGFNDLIQLMNNVISFLLFKMVIPICAIMFAYAGFLLIKAQGGEAKTKAKGIFTNAVIGLVIAFVAWLLIKLILTILEYKDIGMFFK